MVLVSVSGKVNLIHDISPKCLLLVLCILWCYQKACPLRRSNFFNCSHIVKGTMSQTKFSVSIIMTLILYVIDYLCYCRWSRLGTFAIAAYRGWVSLKLLNVRVKYFYNCWMPMLSIFNLLNVKVEYFYSCWVLRLSIFTFAECHGWVFLHLLNDMVKYFYICWMSMLSIFTVAECHG